MSRWSVIIRRQQWKPDTAYVHVGGDLDRKPALCWRLYCPAAYKRWRRRGVDRASRGDFSLLPRPVVMICGITASLRHLPADGIIMKIEPAWMSFISSTELLLSSASWDRLRMGRNSPHLTLPNLARGREESVDVRTHVRSNASFTFNAAKVFLSRYLERGWGGALPLNHYQRSWQKLVRCMTG